MQIVNLALRDWLIGLVIAEIFVVWESEAAVAELKPCIRRSTRPKEVKLRRGYLKQPLLFVKVA